MPTQEFGEKAAEIMKIYANDPGGEKLFFAVDHLIASAIETYQTPIIEEISKRIKSLLPLETGHLHDDDVIDFGKLCAYKTMYLDITGEFWGD